LEVTRGKEERGKSKSLGRERNLTFPTKGKIGVQQTYSADRREEARETEEERYRERGAGAEPSSLREKEEYASFIHRGLRSVKKLGKREIRADSLPPGGKSKGKWIGRFGGGQQFYNDGRRRVLPL